jgi:hypothetical protein
MLYEDGTVIAALFEASWMVYPPAGMLPVNRTSRETQFGSLQAGIVIEARPGSTVMVLAFDVVPDRKQPPYGGQQPGTPRGAAAGVVPGLGEYGECR